MSITDPQFEDIDIPQGSFIGWAELGQTVIGNVVSYSNDGATDFNDQPCPQLVVELTEPAVTFKDKGATRETLDAGEFATITAGQANLRKALQVSLVAVGDIVRIKYESNYKTGKGEGKAFKVQVARGAAVPVSPATAPATEPGDLF